MSFHWKSFDLSEWLLSVYLSTVKPRYSATPCSLSWLYTEVSVYRRAVQWEVFVCRLSWALIEGGAISGFDCTSKVFMFLSSNFSHVAYNKNVPLLLHISWINAVLICIIGLFTSRGLHAVCSLGVTLRGIVHVSYI